MYNNNNNLLGNGSFVNPDQILKTPPPIEPLDLDEHDLNIIRLSSNNGLVANRPVDSKIFQTHRISSSNPPGLVDLTTSLTSLKVPQPTTTTTTTQTTKFTKTQPTIDLNKNKNLTKTTTTTTQTTNEISRSDSLPRRSTLARNIQGFFKEVDDNTIFKVREGSSSGSSDITPSQGTTVHPLKIRKKPKKRSYHHSKPIFPIESNNIFNYEKPKISYKTRDFIFSLKNVLRDFQMLLERNDQSLKTLISKLYLTLKELHSEGNLQILFDDVSLITEIIIRSGYFIQIFRSFFRVINEVKNTEVFFEFLGECKKMVEIINLIIKSRGNENQTRQIISIENDQRNILIKQIKYLIQILLRNEDLISLVQNISYLKKQVDIAKEEQKKAFPFQNMKQSLKYAPLTNEVVNALQSIIGEKPNIRIFVRNIGESFDFIKNNRSYINVMREFTEIIRTIYNKDEPFLTDDQEKRARDSIDKLEIMLIEIFSLPLVVESRVQLSFLFSKGNEDKLNHKLSADLKNLFGCIRADLSDKTRINFQIIHDLKHLVIPYIIKNIHVITLPTITNMNDIERKKKLDYKFENIEIEITKLDPESIKFGLIGSIESVPLKLKGAIKSIVSMEIKDLHLRMNNVKWTIFKHSFPKIKDSGILNISTSPDKGIDLRIKLSFSRAIIDSKHLCNIYKVKCKINDLQIDISKSKHNAIYKKIYKLFKKKITKLIETSIVDQIKAKITEFEVKLFKLFFVEDKDKKALKDLKMQNKIKRAKILERIMVEIPQSDKVSRRFLNNYEILESGKPVQTSRSNSRRPSKDSQEIDEFIRQNYKPSPNFGESPPLHAIKTNYRQHIRRSSQPELSTPTRTVLHTKNPLSSTHFIDKTTTRIDE